MAFFSPSDCTVLKKLVASHKCNSCGMINRSVGYCYSNCLCSGHRPQFEAVNATKVPSLHLGCPKCSVTRLSANGVCISGKLLVCLKGSRSVCNLCQSQVTGGFCSNGSNCDFKRLKQSWKELLFHCLNDALALVYDENDGSFKPKYPESYKSVVRLEAPELLSDPKHFGHVAWLYCTFLSSLDATESSAQVN